ncbi:IclR family transcriptional regulator [Pseudaestuariivita sp.]|uniref:IclR family transcriptional regulator n=1 Tax=Pseudaestuariivita sp. TaxID=2211669 RepID=UPI00405A084E
MSHNTRFEGGAADPPVQQPAKSHGGSGERLLSILDLFTEDRLIWSPAEMMAELGYARPTLYRYLKQLKEAGMLASRPGGRFGLGPRLVELDFLTRASDPVVARSQLSLDRLALRFAGTAFLAQWYGDKLLCVASASRDSSARTSYPRGRPMPLTTGAAAKAILAFLPRGRQEALLAGVPDADGMRTAVRGVHKDGVATAFGEVTPGLVGTAAPILDARRHPLAALCISMASGRYNALDPAELKAAVQDAAAEISRAVAEAEAAPQANHEDPG